MQLLVFLNVEHLLLVNIIPLFFQCLVNFLAVDIWSIKSWQMQISNKSTPMKMNYVLNSRQFNPLGCCFIPKTRVVNQETSSHLSSVEEDYGIVAINIVQCHNNQGDKYCVICSQLSFNVGLLITHIRVQCDLEFFLLLLTASVSFFVSKRKEDLSITVFQFLTDIQSSKQN